MKTAPPPKGFGWRSWEGVAVIRPEEPFEFPISPEKSLSISVKTFFLEITCFWAKKPFEFPISAEKSVSISDKPFESDSRSMKIRVKVAYSCLTLSKKPPPPLFEILATRLLRVAGDSGKKTPWWNQEVKEVIQAKKNAFKALLQDRWFSDLQSWYTKAREAATSAVKKSKKS